MFDRVGRDPATVRELWAKVDAGSAFDLRDTPHWARLAEFGFASGCSSHADRLATIRATFERYGVMIDTHTADGLKVAQEHRVEGIPMLVLETALPAKFEATIREALGREPERPADLANIESLPQRCEVMAVDTAAIKAYLAREIEGGQ